MWQRIQTIYLLLVLIGLLGAFFFPLWQYEQESLLINASIWAGINSSSELVRVAFGLFGGLLGISIGVVLTGLLGYRNRKRQLGVCRIGVWLLTIGVAGAVYGATASDRLWAGATEGALQGGTYALIAALAFSLLAIRGIRRDILLVADAERLR